MKDQYSMFDLPNWQDLPSAISSRGSAAGLTPCASPDGLTIDPAGPDRLPVSPSAMRGCSLAGTMQDTSPPILSAWSGPAAPECCLANRSPARKSSERLQAALESALQKRLNGLGSTIYQIGWKPHATPLGRQISRQRASARRISDSGPSSVPSGWPTPKASDEQMARRSSEAADRFLQRPQKSSELGIDVHLAGWSTASARDWKDTAGMATEAVNPDGSTRTRLDQLPRQEQMAGWPTSRAADGEKNVRTAEGALSEIARKGSPQDLAQGAAIAGWPTVTATDAVKQGNISPRPGMMGLSETAPLAGWPTPLTVPDSPASHGQLSGDLRRKLGEMFPQPQPARFTASGEMLTGCSAGMESGGQLNPEHSRWLMGYPAEWGSCGATAMQSIRTRRRRS